MKIFGCKFLLMEGAVLVPKIRFRCDASGNADDVYLDDIEIIACGNGTNNCLTVGQNCNDNDSCTTDDVYNNDCICLGIPSGDSDSDGICDANDNTNGNCMLNANCDDGDPCTTGETYDSNCNCAGGASVGNNSTSSLAPSDDTFIRGGSYAGNNYGIYLKLMPVSYKMLNYGSRFLLTVVAM